MPLVFEARSRQFRAFVKLFLCKALGLNGQRFFLAKIKG
jgi:hypothetical protein